MLEPLEETLEYRLVLNSSTANNQQIPLFDLNTYASQYDTYVGNYFVTHAYTLENFDVSLNLQNSLAIAPIPRVSPIMSLSESNAVVSEVLANHPKLSIDIFYNNLRDSLGFIRRSEVWLQNIGSPSIFNLLYPYNSLKDMRILDRKNQVNLALRDLGYGLLKGSDYLSVKCSISAKISFQHL